MLSNTFNVMCYILNHENNTNFRKSKKWTSCNFKKTACRFNGWRGFKMVDQVSCYSTGSFNMEGLQIDEDHKVIKDGRIFFGSNFILNKGSSFEFIVQSLPVEKSTYKIELQAKTERSARVELNKMFPQLRHAYSKPRFVSLQELAAAIKKRDEAILKEANY